MNEYTEMLLERLEEAVDTFAEADSDKRYNAARRVVLDRWHVVVDSLEEWEDDEPNRCQICGNELDDAGDDYCGGCWDDMMEEDDTVASL